MEDSTSASVKTLKLDKISDSDLTTIFTNGNSSKLKVTEKIWFENTSNLTISALDFANINKYENYDICATKSSIKDENKEVSENVAL